MSPLPPLPDSALVRAAARTTWLAPEDRASRLAPLLREGALAALLRDLVAGRSAAQEGPSASLVAVATPAMAAITGPLSVGGSTPPGVETAQRLVQLHRLVNAFCDVDLGSFPYRVRRSVTRLQSRFRASLGNK